MLLVAAPAESSHAERAAVRALATQVALALDSAVLSEEVHRRRGEARFGVARAPRRATSSPCCEPDTTVSYQSPSIERVLGYVADDLVGQRFDRLAVARRPRPARAVRGHDRRAASASSRSSAR